MAKLSHNCILNYVVGKEMGKRDICSSTSALGIMEFKIVFVVPSLVVYAHPKGCLESVCLKIAVVWAA